jgi:hypothetical protein
VIDIVRSVAVGIGSFVALTICIYWFQPLGGLISSLGSLPLRYERIRRWYQAIFIDFLSLSFLFKAVGFTISGSGVLVPIVILERYAPDTLHQAPVLWGVCAAALLATLSIMHDVHLMNIPEFSNLLPRVARWMRVDIEFFDKTTTMRLARAHFMDMTVVRLLIVVFCYGIVSYCSSRLGLIENQLTPMVTPIEGVAGALGFIRIIVGSPLVLSGAWGIAISWFYGLCILLYTAFFISLSSKMIDDDVAMVSDGSAVNEPDITEFERKLESLMADIAKAEQGDTNLDKNDGLCDVNSSVEPKGDDLYSPPWRAVFAASALLVAVIGYVAYKDVKRNSPVGRKRA